MAIERWFQESRRSPKTSVELQHTSLTPNLTLEAMIVQWIEKQCAGLGLVQSEHDDDCMFVRESTCSERRAAALKDAIDLTNGVDDELTHANRALVIDALCEAPAPMPAAVANTCCAHSSAEGTSTFNTCNGRSSGGMSTGSETSNAHAIAGLGAPNGGGSGGGPSTSTAPAPAPPAGTGERPKGNGKVRIEVSRAIEPKTEPISYSYNADKRLAKVMRAYRQKQEEMAAPLPEDCLFFFGDTVVLDACTANSLNMVDGSMLVVVKPTSLDAEQETVDDGVSAPACSISAAAPAVPVGLADSDQMPASAAAPHDRGSLESLGLVRNDVLDLVAKNDYALRKALDLCRASKVREARAVASDTRGTVRLTGVCEGSKGETYPLDMQVRRPSQGATLQLVGRSCTCANFTGTLQDRSDGAIGMERVCKHLGALVLTLIEQHEGINVPDAGKASNPDQSAAARQPQPEVDGPSVSGASSTLQPVAVEGEEILVAATVVASFAPAAAMPSAAMPAAAAATAAVATAAAQQFPHSAASPIVSTVSSGIAAPASAKKARVLPWMMPKVSAKQAPGRSSSTTRTTKVAVAGAPSQQAGCSESSLHPQQKPGAKRGACSTQSTAALARCLAPSSAAPVPVPERHAPRNAELIQQIAQQTLERAGHWPFQHEAAPRPRPRGAAPHGAGRQPMTWCSQSGKWIETVSAGGVSEASATKQPAAPTVAGSTPSAPSELLPLASVTAPLSAISLPPSTACGAAVAAAGPLTVSGPAAAPASMFKHSIMDDIFD
jgi:hypothetical protein